jgi:pimeloyl-ACP methyl ester carboxylesterase
VFIILGVPCLILGALAWLVASEGGRAIVSPTREPIYDFQQEILDDPAGHGLVLTTFEAKDGTPVLICTPSENPGVAVKGRAVREILARRGVHLLEFGKIAGTIVMLHGHASRREQMLPIAERFCAAGFRCVIPDMPGHGTNRLRAGSFGFTDKSLPARVLEEVAARFNFAPENTAIFGLSMGGAIAAFAVESRRDLWSSMITVSTFAELETVTSNAAGSMLGRAGFLVDPALRLCALGCYCRARFWPSEVNPLGVHAKLVLPRLFVHGANDGYITPRHAERLTAAAAGSRLILVPKGNHTNTLMIGGSELYADMCQFALAHVDPSQAPKQPLPSRY